MNYKLSRATLFLWLCVTAAFADVWSEAEKKIPRLDASAFKMLPRNVVQAAKNRGCSIPQTYVKKEPHNVITGSFARKGQTDWAVLCSSNSVSSIYIIWGGPTRCAPEIEALSDRDYLQGISKDGIGYSRSIAAASTTMIREAGLSFKGPQSPRIAHDGIEDAFLEKASTIRYCHKGKWMDLVGSD